MIVLYWPAIFLAILGIVYPTLAVLVFPVYKVLGGRLSFYEYWRNL